MAHANGDSDTQPLLQEGIEEPRSSSNAQLHPQPHHQQHAGPSAPAELTSPVTSFQHEPPPAYEDIIHHNLCPQCQSHHPGQHCLKQQSYQQYPRQHMPGNTLQYSRQQLPRNTGSLGTNIGIQEQQLGYMANVAVNRHYGSLEDGSSRNGDQTRQLDPNQQRARANLTYITNRWQELEQIERARQAYIRCRWICACLILVIAAIVIIVVLSTTRFNTGCDDDCYLDDDVCVCD